MGTDNRDHHDPRDESRHIGGQPTEGHSLDGLPPLDPWPAPPRPEDPSHATPDAAGSPSAHTAPSVDQDDWITQDLPPAYYQPGLQMPPRRPRRATPPGSRKPFVIGLSVLLLVALVVGTIYTVRRVTTQTPTTKKSTLPPGCDPNTPCGVAYAYLDAYTGGNDKAMAELTSEASQQRFNDPKILRGNYANGLDYITSRTADILQEAAVYNITATPGKVKLTNAQSASLPALIVMQSSVVGQMNEQITIPLVSEKGQWRVNWSPGLIFPQLDDPNDPTYARVVHLFEEVGHRGTIYDSEGDVIAQDGPNGTRYYPYGAMMAAVTGYVSVVTPQDLTNDKTHYYQQGDMVGHSGLEEWGEQYLRPTKGGTLGIYPRNADGTINSQAIIALASRPAANGDDIHTTINLADQQVAYNGIKAENTDTGGGAFGVDPTTGKVLVMASYPACDPNDFAQGNSAHISACLNNPVHPLLNFAVGSAQPIGSVFKIVTLAAGLSHGIAATQTFTCTGSLLVPGESTPRVEGEKGGHGTLTAVEALPPSCDVIFWQVALELGQKDPNILPNEAKAFGYGALTNVVGVPAGVEDAGLVPDPSWLQSHENAQWSPTDTANLGIGQGFFLATPAQVTMATAAVGDNGTRMQPSLIAGIYGPDGSTVMSFQPKQIGTLPLTSDQLQSVQMAMVGVTSTQGGTTYGVFKQFAIATAGKTGTAQTSQQKPDGWFTCYAPASPLSGPAVAPQIAVTVEVENAGQGADFASPIARNVLASHFHVAYAS